ncbi:MAG: hypothetical protein DLM64_05160 [Solirubrobacterales bacterium]|nr:MAG: hypothetical protein DLM64_05160 [Solirubrobacterales bacterium]
MNTGVRSGVLLAVIGVWIIMRATHKDSTKTADFPDGRTLIDHIIGKQAGSGGDAVPPGGTVTPASHLAGGTPLEPNVGPHVGTRAPPAALVTPLDHAQAAGNKSAAQAAWKQILNWANSPTQKQAGWGTVQVTTWASTQAWWPRFSDLTGTVQILAQ